MTSAPTAPQGILNVVRRFATAGLAISAVIGGMFAYLSGDWIVLPAMLLGWSFWRLLPHDDAPPGLQFSFSYHLFQIIAGVVYTTVTGRYLTAHQAPQYHRMMVIAVVALAAMFAGFLVGDRWLAKNRKAPPRLSLEVTLPQLFVAYVVSTLFRDSLATYMEEVPTFAQAIVALAATQLGVVYLILRKLFREQRYVFVLLLVLVETVRGFSGYYSSFKEPIMLAMIAGMEVFQPRKVMHWALTALLVVGVGFAGVVWLGIRGAVREDIDTGLVSRTQTERIQFAYNELQLWWQLEREYKMFDVDALADRVWDVYYTALALDRVPNEVPYQDGAIVWAAIQHVLTPRFLNPSKPELPSESEDVARYAGIKVAGREQGTTIAFGYVIQSYIDFGLPGMFLPPFAFGLLLGLAYRFFMTTVRHQEILIAVLAVGFWANVMPYNVSWAKMLGKLLTALVYIGGLAVVLDHIVFVNRARRAADLQFTQQPTARLP